jgi:hypothetical protein
MNKSFLVLCAIFCCCCLSWSQTPSCKLHSGCFKILNSDCGIFQSIDCFNAFYGIPSEYLAVSIRLVVFGRTDIFVRRKHDKRESGKMSLKCSKLSNCHYVILILLLSGDIEINPGPALTHNLSFGHLNIASIRNKAASLHNYLIEFPFDVLALNETWLRPDETSSFLSSLHPSEYSLISRPRQHGNGGGVAFLFKKFLKFSQLSIPGAPFQSLEVIAGALDNGNKRICFLNIYRPPSSSFALFMIEFQSILETFISCPSELIISGDFNIHIDNPTDNHSGQFINLLTSFDLKQHMNAPTHHLGHTLDLLITRSESNSVSLASCNDSYLSDHLTITCSIDFTFKAPSSKKRIKYRPWKLLDINTFKLKILASPLLNSPPMSAEEYANQFQLDINNILDELIPEKTKIVTDRPSQPWFNKDISDARQRRSQLERAWRHSKLPSDLKRFRKQCRYARKLVNNSKSEYFSNLINENLTSPKALWQSLNKLLNRNKLSVFPHLNSPRELADKFIQFFADKIAGIRQKFTSSYEEDDLSFPKVSPPNFETLQPTTLNEIRQIVFSSPSKQCLLDIMPTDILKQCFDVLGPVITDLVNLSLSSGHFPSSFAKAVVLPLLKKSTLSPQEFCNYRPISNLNFISKIIERVVLGRVNSHLSMHNLLLPHQSAYRKFHSTETALLAVHNNVINAMDNGKVTALIMLDLSAAFETVDHNILFHRLEHWFGITGIALEWFKSYLQDRTQSVCCNGVHSKLNTVKFGVPQGSVLGPLLFTLYTTPLGSLMSRFSVDYHLYADDSQLFVSFSDKTSSSSLENLSACLHEIQSWMCNNKLALNASKTEFLLLGTPCQLNKFDNINSVSFDDILIAREESVRNLGIIFDKSMSFDNHINHICKITHMQIRDIRRVRDVVPKSALIPLANALVTSRLDYCNSLYNGIAKTNLQKLQRIQNSIARAITKTPKYNHITPVLKNLHWLPVEQRIKFKTSLLVYKILQTGQPQYLKSMLNRPKHSHSTRFSSSLLDVPRTNTELGKRAFSVAGPKIWNSLPLSVRSANSLSAFKSRLKTHLFRLAFPP